MVNRHPNSVGSNSQSRLMLGVRVTRGSQNSRMANLNEMHTVENLKLQKVLQCVRIMQNDVCRLQVCWQCGSVDFWVKKRWTVFLMELAVLFIELDNNK